jgi:polysaccharide biosynthesis/export protein
LKRPLEVVRVVAKATLVLFLLLACSAWSFAQNGKSVPETGATSTADLSSVTLGPGDELTLGAPDIDELDKRVLRVQADGTVNIPEIGPLKAEGLTPEQFQKVLTGALKTQFRDPQISFTSIDVKSKPVSILGAVNHPGVQQADGSRTLLEMISLAGGLRPDAGPVIKVSRDSADDASTFPSGIRPTLTEGHITAEIPVTSLFSGQKPGENIAILPGDVITVPKEKLVYVVGDVKRAGGFPIGETDDFTVLKALSMAEGLDSFADTAHTRILRAGTNGRRTEEEIDLKKLLAGKTEDVRLQANDILFIPNSATKKWTTRAIEASISAGIGYAIWR